MSIHLMVQAGSTEEAAAYNAVLSARGVPTAVDHRWVVLDTISRFTGVAGVKGFIRWADQAQLDVMVMIPRSSRADNHDGRPLTNAERADFIRDYGGPCHTVLARSIHTGAEIADILAAVRAQIVESLAAIGDTCGFESGGVNADSSTSRASNKLLYDVQHLVKGWDKMKIELDQTTADLAECRQALEELRYAVGITWMPAKSRRNIKSLLSKS